MKSQLNILTIAVTLTAIVLLSCVCQATYHLEDENSDWEPYQKNSGEFHPIYNPILTAHLDERPDEELNSLMNSTEQKIESTIAPVEQSDDSNLAQNNPKRVSPTTSSEMSVAEEIEKDSRSNDDQTPRDWYLPEPQEAKSESSAKQSNPTASHAEDETVHEDITSPSVPSPSATSNVTEKSVFAKTDIDLTSTDSHTRRESRSSESQHEVVSAFESSRAQKISNEDGRAVDETKTADTESVNAEPLSQAAHRMLESDESVSPTLSNRSVNAASKDKTEITTTEAKVESTSSESAAPSQSVPLENRSAVESHVSQPEPMSPNEANHSVSVENSTTDRIELPKQVVSVVPDSLSKQSMPIASTQTRESVAAGSSSFANEAPIESDSLEPNVTTESDSTSEQSTPAISNQANELAGSEIASKSTPIDNNVPMPDSSEPQPDVALASDSVSSESDKLQQVMSKMLDDIYTIVLYSIFCFVSVSSILYAKNILGSNVEKTPSVSQVVKSTKLQSNNIDSKRVKELQNELDSLKDRKSQLIRKLNEQDRRRPIIEEVKRLKARFGPDIRNSIHEKRILLRNIQQMKKVQEENEALREKLRLAMYEQLIMIVVWVDMSNLPVLLDDFKFRSKAENLALSSTTMQVESEFLEDHTRTLGNLRDSYIEELRGIDEEIVQIKQKNSTTKAVLKQLRQNDFSAMMGQVDNFKRMAGELDSESEMYYREYLMLMDSILE